MGKKQLHITDSEETLETPLFLAVVLSIKAYSSSFRESQHKFCLRTQSGDGGFSQLFTSEHGTLGYIFRDSEKNFADQIQG